MSLTFSGSIIGISYGEMNSVKSNLRRASDMLQQSQSKINSAKAKVQVDRSSSRLRLPEEQISTIYTNAAKQKTKIDKLCNNIDITIRKFKEVDARCAARIRSISKSYDKSKSIWDRIKSAFSSFSTFAMNGFKSLVEEGKEAICALGEKASEGFSAVSEWMDKHPVVADTLEIVGGVAQAAAYAALFANPITAPIAAVGLIFSASSLLDSGTKLFNYLTTGNNKGINVLEMAFETVGEKLGGDKGKSIGDTIYNVMNTGVMVGGLVIDCGLTLTKTGEIIKDSEGAIKGLKALSEGSKAAEGIKFEALKNFLVNPLKDLVDAGKYLRDNFIPPISFGKLSLATEFGNANISRMGAIAEDIEGFRDLGKLSSDLNMLGIFDRITKIGDDLISRADLDSFNSKTASTKQKGNFGEIKADDNLLNNQSLKDAGYDLRSIGRDAPSGLEDKIVKGIDGLYENINPNSTIKYVIDESKFGSSRLGKTKDGLQMSDDWIKGSDRILKAVDGDKILAKKIMKALDRGQVERVLSKVDGNGKIVTYRLDSSGNIIGIWP